MTDKEEKELKSHPSLKIMRDLLRRYPDSALYPKIIAVLGDAPDEPRLRAAHLEWVRRGWNPFNLAWLFDWYGNNHIPPAIAGKSPVPARVSGAHVGKPSAPSSAPSEHKLSDPDMAKLLKQICPSTATFPDYLTRLVENEQITIAEREVYLTYESDASA